MNKIQYYKGYQDGFDEGFEAAKKKYRIDELYEEGFKAGYEHCRNNGVVK